MLQYLATMLLVGIAHFSIGAWLYHERVTHRFSFLDLDIFAFFVPALLAFSGYFVATCFCRFLPLRAATRISLAVLVAVAATTMSLMCMMTFAFNKWGS